jgi:CheY-like chemotaxis protein
VLALDEHPDLRALSDQEVLALAASEGRILVTFNVKDFPELLRDWAGTDRLSVDQMSTRAPAPLVLVVDDDPGSLLLTRVSIEQAGYRVEAVGGAAGAREVLARVQPDLILMDIRLPGTDGLALTRELKANPDTSSIPVIVLSGNAAPFFERMARAAGAQGFIAKPALPEVIAAQVRSVVGDAR